MVSIPDGTSHVKFETLTHVPLERALIDTSLLSGEEISWINAYHATIIECLHDRLTPHGRTWLTQACTPL
jgi:Xaa-Pro aminopeptidase